MRRMLTLVALALACGLIVAASPSARTVASARASLEIASVDPLRIAGAGFRSHERVRVTAWVDRRRTTARARAGRRGAFQLRIARSTGGMCRSSVTIVAVGNRGSRTTVALANVTCVPTY
ncbi:MAG: hypothetical protein ACRDQT_02665 [Gaiellaceae bacterium]